MQIIINIPKELYMAAKNGLDACEVWDLRLAVVNGMQIPKRNGRLIILSEDAIKREQTSLGFSCQNWISEVGLSNAIVAVIPTNRESEE